MVEPTSIELSVKSFGGPTRRFSRGALAAAVDQKLKDKQIEIQQAILDVQSQMMEAMADRLNLLEQVGQLQQRVRELEADGNVMAGYELVEVKTGMRLWRTEPAGRPDEHLACVRCAAAKKIGVIQSEALGDGRTRLRCSVCGYCEFTGEARKMSARPRGGPGGWMGG